MYEAYKINLIYILYIYVLLKSPTLPKPQLKLFEFSNLNKLN